MIDKTIVDMLQSKRAGFAGANTNNQQFPINTLVSSTSVNKYDVTYLIQDYANNIQEKTIVRCIAQFEDELPRHGMEQSSCRRRKR